MKRLTVLALLALLAISTVACSSDGSEGGAGSEPTTAGDGPAPGREAAAAALADDRTVIDVRTAEEFDAGHVAGADRIGFTEADFADRIAELDPEGSYVVYCRSGNRSAQAAAQMREIGLDVVDGGALDDMVAAGWAQGE